MKRITKYTRLRALVIKPLNFASGREALLKDQEVWIEVSPEMTVWVYDKPSWPDNLLYTFNPEQKPTKHLALIKE